MATAASAIVTLLSLLGQSQAVTLRGLAGKLQNSSAVATATTLSKEQQENISNEVVAVTSAMMQSAANALQPAFGKVVNDLAVGESLHGGDQLISFTALAEPRSSLWFLMAGGFFFISMLLSYLVHFNPKKRMPTIGARSSLPGKSLGPLIVLIFMLHASGQHAGYSTELGLLETSFVVLLFGFAPALGLPSAYGTLVASNLVAHCMSNSHADLSTMLRLLLPWSSWHGFPSFSVAGSLVICELLRTAVDPLPGWITREGLFFVGWIMQFMGLIIFAGHAPNPMIEPVLGFFCSAHIPEYLIGMATKPAVHSEKDPLLGTALMCLLGVLVVATEPSHMQFWLFTEVNVHNNVSQQLGAWVLTPVVCLLLQALSNPADILGRLVCRNASSRFAQPVSMWQLLPAMPALIVYFDKMMIPPIAALLVSIGCVFLLGGLIDELVGWIIVNYHHENDEEELVPPKQAPASFPCGSDSGLATFLYYLVFALSLSLPAMMCKYCPDDQVNCTGSSVKHLFSSSRPIFALEVLMCFALPQVLVTSMATLKFPAHKRKPQPELGHSSEDKLGEDSFTMHFRYCTRGENPNLVEASLRECYDVLKDSGLSKSRWRLQVVTDVDMKMPSRMPEIPVEEIVVPNSYQCPNGGKFKARALHYILHQSAETKADDWIVHLDEETRIDHRCVLACYRHAAQEARAVAAHEKVYCNIGQGCIMYNTNGRGIHNIFTTFCDCARVADDFGKFRMCWEAGRPYFGMHGSFVVVQQAVEEQLGFDHGFAGSITEDTYFALLAWDKMDLKWSWIDAFMFEQSPFTIMDLVRQRARWFQGVALCVTSPDIAWKAKIVITLLWLSWALVALQMSATLLLLFISTGIMTHIVCGTMIWLYALGYIMNFSPSDVGFQQWFLGFLAMFVLQPFIGLVEAVGVLHGLYLFFTRKVQFHVVQKEVGPCAKSATKAGVALALSNSFEKNALLEESEVSTGASPKQQNNKMMGFESSSDKQTSSGKIEECDDSESLNEGGESYSSQRQTPFEAKGCVHELVFASAAAQQFDKCALSCPAFKASITYVELTAHVKYLMQTLQEDGNAVVGRATAVLSERSPALIVGILGSIAAGSMAVPLELEWPEEYLRSNAHSVRPSVIICSNGATAMRSAGIVGSPSYIVLEEDSGRLLTKCLPCAGVADAPVPRSALQVLLPRQAAWSVWTSGSSGKPKLVVYSHNSIVHGCSTFNELCEVNHTSKSLYMTSCVWAAFEWQVFAPLLTGGTVVLAKPGGQRDPAYISNLMIEEQVTNSCMTPTFLNLLLDDSLWHARCNLSHVVSLGAPLSMDIVRKFLKMLPNTKLHNAYGASETGMCIWTANCEPETVNAPVGHPQAHVEVVLVDDEGFPITSPDIIAEICFGGVVQHYYEEEDSTSSKYQFVEPWGLLYFTGDLGKWGPYGLEVLGRKDRQIKINGIRIEPGEIEAQACSIKGVREAACILLPESSTIALFVVPGDCNNKVLEETLSKTLPSYMAPKLVVALEVLPCLPSGKIDMITLSKLAADEINNSQIEITDSLGVVMHVSSDAWKSQRVAECGYAFGLIAVVIHHVFHCGFNGLCETTQPAAYWVQLFVRRVLDADFLIFLFITAGPILDRMRPHCHTFSMREVYCLVIFLLMGLPLVKIQHLLQPWSSNILTSGVHRWYLAVILVARTILVFGHRVATPAIQTTILSTAVALASCPVSWKLPVFRSCVAYGFGLVEAKHACQQWDGEEFFSPYDRKFLIFTLLYIIFFHYGMRISHFAWRSFNHSSVAAVTFLVLAVFQAMCVPYLQATLNGNGKLIQVVIEVVLGCSMAGLLFALFMHKQPEALVWLGRQALPAYVLHPYVIMHSQPWDPQVVLNAVASTITLPALTGLLQLGVVLGYALIIILISTATWRLVFQMIQWFKKLTSKS
jgi:acyl-coenzyme A synthetase/AMP-(fatty) acid ligase